MLKVLLKLAIFRATYFDLMLFSDKLIYLRNEFVNIQFHMHKTYTILLAIFFTRESNNAGRRFYKNVPNNTEFFKICFYLIN